MEKDSGIRIAIEKRSKQGRKLEGVEEIDVVYEASAAKFAWWFCELAFPGFDKDNIRTWENWGTIALKSVDSAFRLRCIKYLHNNGLMPEDTKEKEK